MYRGHLSSGGHGRWVKATHSLNVTRTKEEFFYIGGFWSASQPASQPLTTSTTPPHITTLASLTISSDAYIHHLFVFCTILSFV
jgi:hypothetical protein